MSQWYFAQDGERSGPVDEADLVNMMRTGRLRADSLVWKQGMKAWLPLTQSEFGANTTETPPPLESQAINHAYLWAIAFVPVWSYLLQMISADIVAQFQSRFVYYHEFWWIPIICYSLLITMDFRSLKSAGYDTKRLGGWLLIIVPVYLYKRATLIGDKLTHLWIWIGAMAFSFLYLG